MREGVQVRRLDRCEARLGLGDRVAVAGSIRVDEEARFVTIGPAINEIARELGAPVVGIDAESASLDRTLPSVGSSRQVSAVRGVSVMCGGSTPGGGTPAPSP